MSASRRSREEIVRALVARDRTRVYPVEGLRVGRLWLDQGFALELHPSRPPAEDGALLRLYLAFTLEHGRERRVLDAADHARLRPVFALLGRHVVSAQMTANAGFVLELDDGTKLVAGSLDEADGWDFAQPWQPNFAGP
jgi:Family of unknown function (DUF6188)